MLEASDIFDVVFLRSHNTRLVVICTVLLGAACGMMGSFLLLRKRSLMGDALSHATLPGVCLAFILAVLLGYEGKSLPVLLLGATVSGLAGCGLVLFIRNRSRIKDDAAMGIVLSVFFGLGVVILRIALSYPESGPAGLESFIYGKTASMVESDLELLMWVTGSVLILSFLLFKEFRLLCFDESYAAAQGWPVKALDVLLLGLVTAVTVAGLQAVGLILIIAFLITPAAAAIGGLSGWVGSSFSAFFPRMPTGAVIVLAAAGFFGISLFFGRARGVVVRWFRQANLKRKIGRQHLLRALYEVLEGEAEDGKDLVIRPVPFRQVRGRRTWSDAQLRRYIRQAVADGLVEVRASGEAIELTGRGLAAAERITRNHRLWEMYLIEYAEFATSRVDRDADAVEHVLGDQMVARLESKLETYRSTSGRLVPESPHPIRPGD